MNVLFEPVDIGESIPVLPPSPPSSSSSRLVKKPDDDEREEAEEERNDENKFKIQEEEEEAELYAIKARNECLERALIYATGKENELLIELAHFERACEEKDAIIARLKVDLEEALDAKKREETKRRRKRERRRSAGGRLLDSESVSLLEKATSALELARKESEVLRLKLKEEKKKNKKEEETKKTTKTTKKTKAPARGGRERRRTATPLPETPPFAKQFWSYRNEERRRLAAEERTHPLRFSDEDEDEEEDEEDDFYSDEDEEDDDDTFTEVESESHSSSSSSSSSSSEEEEKEEENYRRDFTNDTTYSSIDELLDRSVVLNSRLEALEQRARQLHTAAKPAT